MAASATAFADSASEAKFRFDRGLWYSQQGRFREALNEFYVAERLAPNPAIVFNIASCHAVLRQYDEAFGAYSEYLAYSLSDVERKEGEEALSKILPYVARLEVVSEPEGASVYLDRKNLGEFGKAPRTFAATPGEHEVIVSLPGHLDKSAKATLAKGSVERVKLVLSPVTEKVMISSAPAGADVFVEGDTKRHLGKTPMEAVLPLGAHRLSIEAAGHKRADEIVLVQASHPVKVHKVLDPLPLPRGRVQVLSNEDGALVRVGDEEIGFTPLVAEVEQGQHTLEVEKPGYRSWSSQVNVDSERSAQAAVTLEPEIQATGRGPWPWVLASTTVASALVTAVLTASAVNAKNDFDAAPSTALYDDARGLNLAADVGLSVTLVSGAATAALFFFGEDVPERQSAGSVSYRERGGVQ